MGFNTVKTTGENLSLEGKNKINFLGEREKIAADNTWVQ